MQHARGMGGHPCMHGWRASGGRGEGARGVAAQVGSHVLNNAVQPARGRRSGGDRTVQGVHTELVRQCLAVAGRYVATKRAQLQPQHYCTLATPHEQNLQHCRRCRATTAATATAAAVAQWCLSRPAMLLSAHCPPHALPALPALPACPACMLTRNRWHPPQRTGQTRRQRSLRGAGGGRGAAPVRCPGAG